MLRMDHAPTAAATAAAAAPTAALHCLKHVWPGASCKPSNPLNYLHRLDCWHSPAERPCVLQKQHEVSITNVYPLPARVCTSIRAYELEANESVFYAPRTALSTALPCCLLLHHSSCRPSREQQHTPSPEFGEVRFVTVSYLSIDAVQLQTGFGMGLRSWTGQIQSGRPMLRPASVCKRLGRSFFIPYCLLEADASDARKVRTLLPLCPYPPVPCNCSSFLALASVAACTGTH